MNKKKAAPQSSTTSNINIFDNNTPIVTGLSTEILSLLKQGLALSLNLTADHMIPETTAGILAPRRSKRGNTETHLQPAAILHERRYQKVTRYILKQSAWSHPQRSDIKIQIKAE